MKRRNIILLVFLSFITLDAFSDDKINIMPYVGLSRTSTNVEILGEEETVTGYEVGAEYKWYEKDELKLGARVGLKNINADATNLFSSYEVQMNVLTIGHSFVYQFDLDGNVLSPYATVDVGLGLAKANGDVLGETFESDSKTLPYASLALGTRYHVGNYIPFIQGGYQYAKVDDIGFQALNSTSTNEVDYSGTYITVGLGMLF